MPRPTKTLVVSDFRRSQILEAARVTMARHGLARTTVDQIARAANVAKGTIYLYFRSKKAIVGDALDEGLAALEAATVPAIEGPGTVEEKLLRFLTGMLGHFDRHRDFVELCQFELGAEMRRQARQTFGRVYAAQTRAWEAVFAADTDAHGVPHLNPRHSALVVVGLAHGLAVQRLRGWTDLSLEAEAAHATAMLWKGLRRQ
jgi:TetR/AcrR family fatty acid metabolism transcriptional regulator